jgi:serine/threonine-protein kinase
LVRDGELPADLALKRGTTVGEYVVEGRLGVGTFGEVYRAIQPLIGKQVAIKVLSRKYSVDPHIVSRFIAEARAVNQIRHKNIIDIFSFGQLPDGRHYHIMELLSGTTLDEHLKAKKRLPVAETIVILQALARALDAAHAAGIAHRDLKPANVFLGHEDDGKPFPKLLDFGIAKLMSDDVPRHHQTATGAAVGTPDYMSPEQCQGPDVDHRTDIYAFGVMTYQLLTGRLPFVGTNVVEVLVKQMTATADPPSRVVPDLPDRLDEPILWMMSKKKEDRPQNLATAIRALEDAARASGIEVAKSSSTGDPLSRPSNPPPAMIAATYHLADTLPSSSAKPVSLPLPSRPKPRTGWLIAGIAVLAIIPLVVSVSKLGANSDLDEAPLAVAPVLAALPIVEEPKKPEEPVREEPKTIELRVSSTPAEVAIYAGDVQLGKAPCVVNLPRGSEPVELELRREGYETLKKTIVPIADGELEVQLKKKVVTKTATKKQQKSKAAPNADDVEDAFGD